MIAIASFVLFMELSADGADSKNTSNYETTSNTRSRSERERNQTNAIKIFLSIKKTAPTKVYKIFDIILGFSSCNR